MLALAIARVIKHRRQRRCSTEGPIITGIDPTSAGVGLAFAQNRNRRVITMQTLGAQEWDSSRLFNGAGAAQADPTVLVMAGWLIGTPLRT